jgi:chromosome partitioning protein
LLTINGLVAADEVFIPLEAEFLAYRGIDTIVGIIETVRTHFNQNLFISGVFLTKYNRQRILTKSIREEVSQYFGDVLFDSKIFSLMHPIAMGLRTIWQLWMNY